MSKRYIFIAAIILLLLLIIFIALAARSSSTNESFAPSPTITQTLEVQQKKIQVVSILPKKNTSLTPGIIQEFVLTISQPLDFNTFLITMQRKDLTKENRTEPISISLAPSKEQTEIRITPSVAILPLSLYQLTIMDKATNTILFQTEYLSDEGKPTPVVQNNQSLAQFLPYETPTYRLSYKESENIYVFNFKVDPNSQYDLETQFQKAQADALNYIKSKNIDPSTVVIDWRHS